MESVSCHDTRARVITFLPKIVWRVTYIVRSVKSFAHSSKLKGDGRHKKQLKIEEKKKDSSILDPSASEDEV